MKRVSLLLLLFSFYAISLRAQPGTLDQAFGGDGLTSAEVGTIMYPQGQCMALTPDQKVVVAGYYFEDSSHRAFAAVRFLSNGSLDPGFGTGGIVTLPLGLSGDGVTGVAVQSDGSIVLVGSYFFGTTVVGAVRRLTSSGQADPNFHGGGILLVVNYRPRGVAIGPSGNIIVVCDNGIFKVSTNGTLDNSFGTGGELSTGTALNNTCVAVQPDGMIVAGGYTTDQNTHTASVVRRYTSKGLPDPNFGIGGQMDVSVGTEGTTIFGVALQSDNKVLLSGCYSVYNNGWVTKGLVERLNTTGIPDNSFSGNGKQQVNFSGYDELFSIAEQTDGKIVAAGFTLPETGPHPGLGEIALCRLNKDGSLNSDFGTGGKVMTYWPNSYVTMYSLAIQGDGKIVVGGDGDGYGAARYQVTKIPSASTNPSLETGAGAVLGGPAQIHLFPNPVSSRLQVQGLDANSPNFLTVRDASGKTLVFLSTEQSSTSMDIQMLRPGVYYLEWTVGSKQQTIPFVKLR
jgi:uncharacterized delta-60 repeat protein